MHYCYKIHIDIDKVYLGIDKVHLATMREMKKMHIGSGCTLEVWDFHNNLQFGS